ncbi:Hypothetical protein CAP_3761 [Chondromyces apiculatus DSM 436]|uniref:Uncharacterized protein n=1 Tax=Chondromyces apiculatus DSM 436 TaxID=1192034 RepID=A0A017T817_9BACT|nr:Hypothetical protein CAP_3761 [Chondromyces apiculatus DSM 436]
MATSSATLTPTRTTSSATLTPARATSAAAPRHGAPLTTVTSLAGGRSSHLSIIARDLECAQSSELCAARREQYERDGVQEP